MEELKKLLTDPFDGKRTDEIAKTVENIAKTLFRDYYIDCNGKKFYFAEIEFYYWQNDELDKGFNQKWNRVTYPRISQAGDFLFHLSGVDICFNSYYNIDNFDASDRFGGILIRSIRDEAGNVTAGPWNCMLKIINECRGGMMPQILKADQPCNIEKNIKSTYRALGKDDQKKEEDNPLKLCFYDSSIPKDKWGNQIRVTLVKDKGVLKKNKSSYKTDRFELEG
jgi:hypothetical protein